MNRLYIVLTAAGMVIGTAFFFDAHEALAEAFIGTTGNDSLVGTDGNDELKGRAGDDHIDGGGGDDIVRGGLGNDVIIPGENHDQVFAGAGNDRIYARDTDGVDIIDCGSGFDRVETIHRDDRTRSNCERTPGPNRGNI